jgi:hypothetical protein
MDVAGYKEYFSSQIIDTYLQMQDHYLESTGPVYKRMDLPEEPVKKTDELIYATSNIGLPQPTKERQDYNRTKRETLGSTPINPVKYSQTVDLTEEAIWYYENGDDEYLQRAIDEAKELPTVMFSRVDLETTDVWRLGFGQTKHSAYDGKPLFASDHPLKRSSNTNDNTMGNAKLNPGNLKSAREKLNRMQLDDGQPIKPATNLCLMVGPDNQPEAWESASAIGDPETANNRPNYNHSIEVLVNPWLKDSYANYWFLIAKDRIRRTSVGLKWLKQPIFGADGELTVGYETHAAVMDFDVFLNTYQHSVGSKGA